MEAEREDLLDHRLPHSDAEVTGEKAPPTDLPFHNQAEHPEKDHVSGEVENIAMDEVAGEPLERMEAVPPRQPKMGIPLGRPAPDGEEHEDIRDDQADRGDRPVVDRRVGRVGKKNEHAPSGAVATPPS